MKIITSYLTNNLCFINAKNINIQGIMLHSTGTAQSKALPYIKAFNTPKITKCVHAFIQDDGIVYNTLPWNYKAWHCGKGIKGSGNSNMIGIEICEPSSIKYINNTKWVDLNPIKTKASILATYNIAVELFATLCKQYNLNPLQDGVVICHYEGSKRGIASNHADVYHLWTPIGLSMDQFRIDIYKAINNKNINGNISTNTNDTNNSIIKNNIVNDINDTNNTSSKIPEIYSTNLISHTKDNDNIPNITHIHDNTNLSNISTNIFPKIYKVNVNKNSYLNIRNLPNKDGNVVGKLYYGQLVVVEGIDNNWYKINGNKYIHSDYLIPYTTKYDIIVKACSIKTKVNMNVRKSPLIDKNNIIGTAKKDNIFTVVGIYKNTWLLLKSGGYIYYNNKYMEYN